MAEPILKVRGLQQHFRRKSGWASQTASGRGA